MGSLISETLENAWREKRIIAMRTNMGEPTRFFLGYIVKHNDEAVVLKMVNQNGLQHGLQIIRTADIFQVDCNDRYIRNIELKENNLDKIHGGIKNPDFMEEVYVSISEILLKSRQLRRVIYFDLYSGMHYYGIVTRLNEEEFILESYTEYGEPDGTSVFRLEDIKTVVWSDEDTRAIELRLQKSEPAK